MDEEEKYTRWLREEAQRDEQEALTCSNPDCPLDRSHSGPCAPKGFPVYRE